MRLVLFDNDKNVKAYVEDVDINLIDDYKDVGFVETDDEYILLENKFYPLNQELPTDVFNSQQRQMREEYMKLEADPLKYDYEEAVAINMPNAEDLKKLWIDKKEEIRKRFPYR